MIKRLTTKRLRNDAPIPAKVPLVLIILILVFLLVAWGIWWYFDYKITMLERQALP